MSQDRNKLLVTTALLLACVGFSVWGNQHATGLSNSSNSARLPAGSFFQQLRSGTLEIERKLASQLSEFKKRHLASLGRPPDPMENFRFGVLEGKYALTMNGEKIHEIDFIDNPNTEGRPKVVSDRGEFLKKFAGFFGATILSEKVDTQVNGAKITEIYRFKTVKADEDIMVHITVDDLDRLVSVKTQSITPRKIF